MAISQQERRDHDEGLVAGVLDAVVGQLATGASEDEALHYAMGEWVEGTTRWVRGQPKIKEPEAWRRVCIPALRLLLWQRQAEAASDATGGPNPPLTCLVCPPGVEMTLIPEPGDDAPRGLLVYECPRCGTKLGVASTEGLAAADDDDDAPGGDLPLNVRERAKARLQAGVDAGWVGSGQPGMTADQEQAFEITLTSIFDRALGCCPDDPWGCLLRTVQATVDAAYETRPLIDLPACLGGAAIRILFRQRLAEAA